MWAAKTISLSLIIILVTSSLIEPNFQPGKSEIIFLCQIFSISLIQQIIDISLQQLAEHSL